MNCRAVMERVPYLCGHLEMGAIRGTVVTAMVTQTAFIHCLSVAYRSKDVNPGTLKSARQRLLLHTVAAPTLRNRL